jgi:hypothetical protein
MLPVEETADDSDREDINVANDIAKSDTVPVVETMYDTEDLDTPIPRKRSLRSANQKSEENNSKINSTSTGSQSRESNSMKKQEQTFYSEILSATSECSAHDTLFVKNQNDDTIQSESSPSLQNLPTESWSCDACTYLNEAVRRICDMCGEMNKQPRRSSRGGSTQGGDFFRPTAGSKSSQQSATQQNSKVLGKKKMLA